MPCINNNLNNLVNLHVEQHIKVDNDSCKQNEREGKQNTLPLAHSNVTAKCPR